MLRSTSIALCVRLIVGLGRSSVRASTPGEEAEPVRDELVTARTPD